MYINKQKVILFIIIPVIISLPFLEFLVFNLNLINERTDFRVNTLTLQRLSSLYLLFILIFLISFAFLQKK